MIERTPAPLDPLALGEIDDIVFTFKLAAGETISAQAVTVTTYRGADPSPSAIKTGVATVAANTVVQRVTPAVAAVVYTLVCAATTSTGRRLLQAVRLPVVDLAVAWS